MKTKWRLYSWVLLLLVSLFLGARIVSDQVKIEYNFFNFFEKDLTEMSQLEKVTQNFSTDFLNKTIVSFEFSTSEQASKDMPALKEKLCQSNLVEKCLWQSAGEEWAELYKYYAQKTPYLVTAKDQLKIKEGPGSLLNESYRDLFSSFNASSGFQLKQDPLGFLRHYLETLSAGPEFSKSSDLLIINQDNKSYAFVFVDLKPMSSRQNKLWQAHMNHLKLAAKNSIYVLSGPLYAVAGEERSIKEMNVIGSFSMAAILLLLLFAFRSLKPILITAVTLATSLYWAFIVSYLCFGSLHIATLLMGLGLLGLVVDYCIHYLSHSTQKKSSITLPLLLSLLTSVVGYASFSFSSLLILKQLAVFSAVGLISAVFTVLWLLPVFKWNPLQFRTHILIPAIFGLKSQALLFSALVLALFYVVNFNDDVKLLQKRDVSLFEQEQKIKKILGFSSSNSHFIITASSFEELVQKEEAFASTLMNEYSVELRELNYLAKWSPSLKSQEESLKQYLKSKTIAESLYKKVNYKGIKQKLDELYGKKPDTYIQAAEWLSKFKELPSSELYLGSLDNEFYSLFVVSKPIVLKSSLLPNGVEPWNKAKMWTDQFTQLRAALSGGLGVVLVLLIFSLCLWLGLYKAIELLRAPVLSVLGAALMGQVYFGYLNLFHLLGLTLVFFLTIDYSFFRNFSKPLSAADKGISLSMLTTLISFVGLSFSSTAAVQALGFTVSVGVVLSACLLKQGLWMRKVL